MNEQDYPTSRRAFLTAGAALAAGATASPMLPQPAAAQGDPDLAQLQGQRRILLKGGVVLTLDRQVGDFANADILIEDGKIREIRPNIAASGDGVAVVDATNRILVPGFIDTHSHSYQGLLRSSLPNGLVDPDYNRDVQNKLTPAYAPTDVYAGVLATALAFIEMGTTTIVDLSQISHTPEHSDANIRALQEAGIRALYGYSRGAGTAMQWPQDLTRLQKTYFSTKDQLLTLGLGASLEAKVVEAARAVGVPAVMHFRINSDPGLALGRAGVLREGDLFIHCTHLNDAAWQMIKDIGGRISMSPPLEMAMAHGLPSVQDALDRGVRPSLSSDHGTTVAQDMFSLMRTTFNLQRLRILQRKRSGEQDLPALLTCREVLEFATIAGARAAGVDGKVGTLTPGKEADIVVLKADRLDIWPLNNAPSVVANLMNPSHVESVFIAGKVRKWRGNLVGVDVPRVLRLAQEAREAVFRRSGFEVSLLG
ncbi:MAG: 5-methylthioadenosine/S-adenosylhomocysteine deaminase [Alphaproteobacteria bacterium]|jgi:cytosine/adenosine deaminase-related metal-dependent hydrolase|nr:5-methylthioadenosine/S-adenosylhomocysteine deaminase [Alphaproteobacteria bacterium]